MQACTPNSAKTTLVNRAYTITMLEEYQPIRMRKYESAEEYRAYKRKRRKENYDAYMDSPEWRALKIAIIKERGRYCQRCGGLPNTIYLHHLTYKRFGREWHQDLVLVCFECHKKEHPGKKLTEH